MSWQFLGAVDIVMIVAALLEGGLKVAGVAEIPIVRSRVGFIGLLIDGLAFLGLEYMAWRDRPPSETWHQNAVVAIVNRVMDTIDKVVDRVGFGGFAQPELAPASDPKDGL